MVLALKDIHLSLPGSGGTVPILHGVSMSLPAAASVAVVGPSGSGKTSLLLICAGLLRPTSGQIVFEGRDISAADEGALSALRRDRMGIVFQNFHLIPTMTAVENVAIPMELAGIEDAGDRAAQTLSSVGLGHRLAHYPSQLSGGEQQRVAIARALAMKPRLILADEPTGNLDQDTGRSIMNLLFERVQAQGATLVLVTHDPALASACNMQVHIKDGRVARA